MYGVAALALPGAALPDDVLRAAGSPRSAEAEAPPSAAPARRGEKELPASSAEAPARCG
jgi:hypothetical protein